MWTVAHFVIEPCEIRWILYGLALMLGYGLSGLIILFIYDLVATALKRNKS